MMQGQLAASGAARVIGEQKDEVGWWCRGCHLGRQGEGEGVEHINGAGQR
jgi:hypothetical protein